MTLSLQNKLNELDAGTFDDNKNLKKLWLNNNQISELQPGLFKNLNNLKYLNLIGNQIKCIQPYGSPWRTTDSRTES
jgi:Leucine-rich repeat (LRR) protein